MYQKFEENVNKISPCIHRDILFLIRLFVINMVYMRRRKCDTLICIVAVLCKHLFFNKVNVISFFIKEI